VHSLPPAYSDMHKASFTPAIAMTFAKYFKVFLPLVLFIVLTVESAKSQTFTDSIKVHLENYNNISKKTRCVVTVATVGTHADPRGTGGGYTYVWYRPDGTRRTDINSVNVAAWVGLKDDPGNFVTMTKSYNSSDSPGDCNYELIAECDQNLQSMVLHAHYTTSGGPVAFYHWKQNKGLSVNFDASESYVATITGHKPITSYLWSFGDGGTSSEVTPTYTYQNDGIYKVVLQAFDDKGKVDTCVRTVEVKGALLSVRARIIEERADKGDTLTVIGIIENVGATNVSNVVAGNSFAMVFEFHDSVSLATLVNPILTSIPQDPVSTMKAVLAPGESFEVERKYVVSRLATYRRADMDSPEDIPVQVKANLIELAGEDPAGESVRVIRPCDKDGAASECERNHAVIGSVGTTLVVNSIENAGDENAGDDKCNTGKMIDVNGKMVPECTLRAAIEEANASAGPQKIIFKIPGSGIKTIKPDGKSLPDITEAVVIDATTQPGYTSSPMIYLDGSMTAGSRSGFTIDCSDCSLKKSRIKGFVIGNFHGAGIRLVKSSELHIEQNYIGTDVTGKVAAANKEGGIDLLDADRSVIDGNLISGNGAFGIALARIEGIHSGGTTITGNRIGTNLAGTAGLPNQGPGVLLGIDAQANFIGKPKEVEKNIISGNNGHGISILGHEETGTPNYISGNYIGTDITGKKRVANLGDGINVSLENGGVCRDKISGNLPPPFALDASPTNLISGNEGVGIHIIGKCNYINCAELLNLSITGNYIGTDISGTKPLGNIGSGIHINQLGGALDVTQNIISSNADGVVTEGYARSASILVSDNLIGCDVSRLLKLGNKGDGIRSTLEGSLISTGRLSLENNFIVANARYGTTVSGSLTTELSGNRIGLTITDDGIVTPMGNAKAGVFLGENSRQVTVGSHSTLWHALPKWVNYIAYNGAGIVVTGGTQNWLAGNFIFNNGDEEQPQIDLGNDGPTNNDTFDEDEGPNDLTNYPYIIYAYATKGELFIYATLPGHSSSSTYDLDFYVNARDIDGFSGVVQGYVERMEYTGSNGAFSMCVAANTIFPARSSFNKVPEAIEIDLIWTLLSQATDRGLFGAGYGMSSELSYPLTINNAPKLVGATDIGAFEVALTDQTGFEIGDDVIICPGCDNEETATIIGHGSLIFKEPLKYAHAVGEAIVPFARSFDSTSVSSNVLEYFHSGTAVSLNFVGVTEAGSVTAERFRRAPIDLGGVSDSSVLPHRWVLGQDSTLTFNDSTEIRFRLSGIPNLVLDSIERTAERLNVYHRPVPGSGSFTQLPTRYDKMNGTIGASGFTTLGEFILARDRPLGIQIGRDTEIPSAFALSVAYPNPFNATTSLTLALPQAGEVAVVVFNSLGQQVAVLYNGRLSAGTHTVQFDARDLTSGVYFIQAKSAQGGYTRQVLYMP
jgi:parallel beta-helix repeat protein